MTTPAAEAPVELLLIEDDVIDEMATLRTVGAAALPWRVHLARSVAQARSVLAERSFDVILADYQLADGTSFDLMDAFGDQLVIFVTGDWDASAAARALRLGVHDYLIKDAAGTYLQLLEYRVETALRQRRLARALRESEARLQAILDHAPASISVHDLQGRPLLSNRHHAARASTASAASAPHTPLRDEEYEETRTESDGLSHTYVTVRFPMTDAAGRPQAVGAISVDITARKQAEQQIRQLAFFDPLTGLPNRRMLFDRLQQAFATSARHASCGAVFFIDLDHFKRLNDTLGHDHGDLLLQEVARRLLACVRSEDTVARIGGDEFVVMTVNLAPDPGLAATQAAMVGDKILAAIGRPCRLGRHEHSVTPSVGVTLFHGREAAVEDILKRADLAMYQAKAAGRASVRHFDPLMQSALDQRHVLEAELQQAVAAGQLNLHFQGQFDAARGLVGAEVLLRWQHPRLGLLAPAQFLPLAEQNGMILPIGRWVIDAACAQLARWSHAAPTRHLRLAVNLSARQFGDAGFVDSVLSALRGHAADPALLRLELRQEMVQDDPSVRARMASLAALGVGFALDDFGISPASLAHIRRLPLQQIKISRALIAALGSDPHDLAIVQTILGVAAGLGLDAVATGVETAAQRDCVRGMGCLLWQGHCEGEAAPLALFEAQTGLRPATGRPLAA